MFRDFRYIFGFFVAIGLAILIILLLFINNPSSRSSSINVTKDYYNNSSAEFVMQGPIVASQDHNYIQINVNSFNVTFDLYQGYSGNHLLLNKVYNNSPQAYLSLLEALKYSGFASGINNNSNGTGYCSYGDVYTFYLYQNNKQVLKYWGTNCSGTPQTYAGNIAQTVQLFENQIPNFNNLIQNANF